MKIPIIIVVVIWLGSDIRADGALGLNWGRQSAQRLLPSQAVDLILQNGIQQARIFTAELDVLNAFAGSGINLTVGMHIFLITKYDMAKAWAIGKRDYFVAANVRNVLVGDKVFYNGIKNKSTMQPAMDCLKIVQAALNDTGLSFVKTNTQHTTGMLKQLKRPSEAEFADEIKDVLIDFLNFIQAKGSPFMIEITPNYDTKLFNLDERFAFPNATHPIVDNNGTATNVYTNIFEFVYDSFAYALDKLNFSNMKIVVTQVGWPTDGCDNCNASLASQYYKFLLPFVTGNKGTPKRPGAPIDTFLHALTDENLLDYNNLPFSRHWGIYRSNGSPKYSIDLSGKGNDSAFPAQVRGIWRMPNRWCVLNKAKAEENRSKVQSLYDNTCQHTDCTALLPGGSCSELTFEKQVSFALNMLFQFTFQNEKFCNYDGLAYVTVDDPSTEECIFPVEVVKGQQNQLIMPSAGDRVHQRPTGFAILVFLVSIFGTFTWNLQ